MAGQNRNFGLDLVRATAILLVLIAHVGFSKFGFVRPGYLGVEIFFVLSGFLIGQILIRNFADGAPVKVILDFWSRRWFRTLPLYYLIIILKFVLLDHSLGPRIIVYFFFLQNNFVGIDFMPVSWSLVLEEWFYLLLPILLFVFFQNGITAKRFLIFILLFILAENIFRLVWVQYANRPWGGIVGNFPFRLDSLMAGVLLAAVKIFYGNIYNKLKSTSFFIVSFLLFVVVLYLFGRVEAIPGLKDELLWTRTIWFSMLSITIGMMFPFVEAIAVSEQSILKKIITQISLLTYAVYLLHMEIINLVITEQKKYSLLWDVQVGLAIVTTFILAYIVYRFYEHPMTNLRDKIKIK